jgi:hypothetical protein
VRVELAQERLNLPAHPALRVPAPLGPWSNAW